MIVDLSSVDFGPFVATQILQKSQKWRDLDEYVFLDIKNFI